MEQKVCKFCKQEFTATKIQIYCSPGCRESFKINEKNMKVKKEHKVDTPWRSGCWFNGHY